MRTELSQIGKDGKAKIWRFWIGHLYQYAGVLQREAITWDSCRKVHTFCEIVNNSTTNRYVDLGR
ncbi:hypothetical protein BV22DRAFT_1040571 [Leucogyrophana mollusca]|uniref:Uncharacterized protein n=1 Tax=Leucogyrophana mollusca TaxID=85980 RepID=A0ACB8B286_9AGAM|nr:hypothetical protein BV22DRAFT_1040571 [Leucogyrophana mollusca]